MDTKRLTSTTKKRLLIVDDDDLVRGLLVEVLSDGYDLEAAASCEAALERLKRSRFDLMLTDVNMPDMSGKDLLDVCLAKYPKMSVIIMTGAPEFTDAVDLLKQGAFDYLPKPIDMGKLIAKIAEAITDKERQARDDTFNECMTNTTKLDSKYKVVRSIGSGNSGVVLLVMKDGRQYAMKILREEADPERHKQRLNRFLREAEILSSIEHPGVVKVFDFDLSTDAPVSFILMEYIDGRPLSKHIQADDMPMNDRLRVIMDVADALHYVHSFGILHRDIKPDNILINRFGEVKITDFGISRISDSCLTMTDEIMGSPMYMAPECFDSSRAASVQSDIFSLGVVAYEFLTGLRPFKGDNIYQVAKNVKEALPTRPTALNIGIPDWMENTLGRMLAKEPRKRFDSVGDIAAYIRRHDERYEMTNTSRLLRNVLHSKKMWS